MTKEELSKQRSEIAKRKYAEGWSPRKGKKHTEETKDRIRHIKIKQGIVPKTAFKKGVSPWNKGIVYGTQSYGALHKWIYKNWGSPKKCEKCGVTSESNRKINWANKNHKYSNDKKDWMRLCAKCHRQYDYDTFYWVK